MRPTRRPAMVVTSALLCAWLSGPMGTARAASLPDVPASGLDPDVQAAMTSAQQLLASGQAEAALMAVISLYSATDRFTVAQRPLLLPEALRVLGEAGAQLQSAGRTDLALMAQDAAWAASGRPPNPAYSQTLTALATQAQATKQPGSREESLYLARRALLADPGNQAAAQIDRRLSTNRFKVPGLALVIGGSVIAGIGFITLAYTTAYSSDSTFTFTPARIGGIGALLGGGLIAGTGGLLLSFGKPVSAPVSPAYLPALPESATAR